MSEIQDELELELIEGTDFITPDQINDNMDLAYKYIKTLYENMTYVKNQSVYYGSLNTAGYITSSKSKVYFTIPVSHIIVASSVTVSANFRIRQQGNYLVGSSDTYESMPVTAAIPKNKNWIRCYAESNHVNHTNISGAAGTEQNNAPCGLAITGITLDFK